MPNAKNRAILREEKFKAQGGMCHWCGTVMSFTRRKNGCPARDFATFEHLKRRRHGGTMEPNNIVLAHEKCNRKREYGIRHHDRMTDSP